MRQISNDKLCFYCLGCIREENEEFAGINNCKAFIPAVKNWQNLIYKARKEKKK